MEPPRILASATTRAVVAASASAAPTVLVTVAFTHRSTGWPAGLAFAIMLATITGAALLAEHRPLVLATLVMMLSGLAAVLVVYLVTGVICRSHGRPAIEPSQQWLVLAGAAYVASSVALLRARPGRVRQWPLALVIGVVTAFAALAHQNPCATAGG